MAKGDGKGKKGWSDRDRKKDWSYYVVTHDWPVGVGTVSESLPREARYKALKSFDSAYKNAMNDLAQVKPDDPRLPSEHPVADA